MDDEIKVIRKPGVIVKTGLSGPTIDRQEARGEFPQRIQLGPNCTGWIEAEIDQWLMSRKRGPLPIPNSLKQGNAA